MPKKAPIRTYILSKNNVNKHISENLWGCFVDANFAVG